MSFCLFIYYIYIYIYIYIYMHIYIQLHLYISIRSCQLILSIVTSIVFIYFLETVQSFPITWTITYSKKLRSSQDSAESFWVILGVILMVFIYSFGAVKPFLINVCIDYSCITPMLYTTLKKFQGKSSSPGDHFGVFFGLPCGIFLCFLRNAWFLMKYFRYIVDSTLIVVKLKTLQAVLSFAWSYFELFYGGGGGRGDIFRTHIS